MKALINALSYTFFVICLIIIFTLVSYGGQMASYERVQTIIEKAEHSVNAKSKLSEYLKSKPAPTNNELDAIEKEIDESIVIDLSRKFTGDSSFTSSRQDEQSNVRKVKAERENLIGKAWSELSGDEKWSLVKYKIEDYFFLFSVFLVGFSAFSLARISFQERRRRP